MGTPASGPTWEDRYGFPMMPARNKATAKQEHEGHERVYDRGKKSGKARWQTDKRSKSPSLRAAKPVMGTFEGAP
jgi:hypothetical protein